MVIHRGIAIGLMLTVGLGKDFCGKKRPEKQVFFLLYFLSDRISIIVNVAATRRTISPSISTIIVPVGAAGN